MAKPLVAIDRVKVTPAPAISSDERLITDAASTWRLFLRSLDDFAARPGFGCAGAQHSFFSPGGRTVGFFADGKPWRLSRDPDHRRAIENLSGRQLA
jgi:hypothetical protein